MVGARNKETDMANYDRLFNPDMRPRPVPLVNPVRTMISDLVGVERMKATDDPMKIADLLIELLVRRPELARGLRDK